MSDADAPGHKLRTGPCFLRGNKIVCEQCSGEVVVVYPMGFYSIVGLMKGFERDHVSCKRKWKRAEND